MSNAFLSAVFAQYGWNSPLVQTVGSGLINRTWKIQVGDHVYILQEVNTQVFSQPGHIDHNLRLLAGYFAHHAPGYLFTAPIPALSGDTLVEHKGQYYRAFPWINGSHTVDVVTSTAQASEAAAAFGAFTHLLENFDANRLKITLRDFHNLSLRYTQFEMASREGNAGRIADSADLIGYLRSCRDILSRYEAFIAHPEAGTRVTHHDTKISNVLFGAGDKSLCVIDLDTVMPGYFISDVGDMFRTYTCSVSEEENDLTKVHVRKEYVKAVATGYLSKMNDTLTNYEKDHLYFGGEVLIYMQALRFLTDHLENDRYYGARYPGHNQFRAANQARLLALFRETV